MEWKKFIKIPKEIHLTKRLEQAHLKEAKKVVKMEVLKTRKVLVNLILAEEVKEEAVVAMVEGVVVNQVEVGAVVLQAHLDLLVHQKEEAVEAVENYHSLT